MKARVINKSSLYYNMNIDIKLLDSRLIYGMLTGTHEKVEIPFDDVELQFEYDWEKYIVKYRELLEIVLPSAVTLKFYAVLCLCLEEHFKEDINHVVVIKDINENVRKNYWYKNIDVLINNTCPVNIRVSGKKYSDLYNVNMETLNVKCFESECRENISMLKELINKSSEKMGVIETALDNINKSYIGIDGHRETDEG